MKLTVRIFSGLCALIVIALCGIYVLLKQSLPTLDGDLAVHHIANPVVLERDAQGILQVQGKGRSDIAFGLGFAHAQDRFFQMDLQRRNAAGELSELFGEAALEHDKKIRLHQFRKRAQRNLSHLEPDATELLNAYSNGVNQGLNALRAVPFEYTLLGEEPAPWRPEDSLLTVFSMILVLQDNEGWFERTRGLMAEHLPADLYAFFAQQGGRWDAPLMGEPLASTPIPGTGWAQLLDAHTPLVYQPMVSEDVVVGSNNWAVSGALTPHGGAMVADDMHLAIRVPNIWYRAQWQNPNTGRLVSGATLPGTPIMVAGSNGKLAWGFTNTQGDWSDIVLLETDADNTHYKTAEGWAAFEESQELIHIKGEAPVQHTVRTTRWGPVIATDAKGRQLAYRWTAHDPSGANMGPGMLEELDDVAQAINLGPQLGMPHQNLVLADAEGTIGWTVAGPFPKRIGTDGKLPEYWHTGDKSWQGVREGNEHPKLLAPQHHRLWTANARTLSGEAFEIMGDSAYALGARQQQIRDGLFAKDTFSEQDFLDIQLDDRAIFLTPWRNLLLAHLEQAGDLPPALKEAQAHLENWGARASVDSVGYRLVRAWRLKVIEYLSAPLITYMQQIDPAFDLAKANRQIEYPAWALITEKPAHLLNPDFSSWQALERRALNAVIEPLYKDNTLANDTWGEANRVKIQHPLARFVAPIDWWMSMPHEPLAGDTHMPRVQTPTHGASERFAVSPGREDQAFFHMATGQSAHPLSEFFSKGHSDWSEGRLSPWLKGATAHTLNLTPLK
ncbi:penicillin acylase family protein [Simiduia sp. 21SJ11W-1]|uniref:penicillin acylase family protein n=1 Tax=Simiduia sp. 21SJ11W-1 TaxID=2909669 RepID=UPI0020A00B51|nr:penicillin acylase family protein [Simiduia sp. 21SJ11W-1]UTA49201.1 penicillin acylase family protein [Simiduia sp. 21SJ11W-1]